MNQSMLSKEEHDELIKCMTIEPAKHPISGEPMYTCTGQVGRVFFHVIGKTRAEVIDRAFAEILRPF